MKRYSFLLSLITALSIMFAITANIVSGRVSSFPGLGWLNGGFSPIGVFFFPFIYILSDITSDVYGYGVSRRIAWTTLLCQLLSVFLVLGISFSLRPAPFTTNLDSAIKLVFATSVRVTIGSCVGAILGGWVNDIIFQLFRHKDGEDKFLKRKLLSSLGAEIVDTASFITIAFIFTPGWSWQMYIIQFILKYAVEVITSPVAKVLAKHLRNIEGSDVFEDRNKFNILGFEKLN